MRIDGVRSGCVLPYGLLYGLATVWAVSSAGCRFHEYSAPAKSPSERKPIAGLTSITVVPDAVDVAIDKGTPVTQQFQAWGVVNGTRGNITDMVKWSISPATYAKIDAGTGLVTAGPDCGGVYQITAESGLIKGRASLTVHFKGAYVADPGGGGTPVPTDAGTRFGGSSDKTRAPTIVYPNDFTAFPPNIPPIEVHWKKAQETDTLFDLWFKNSVTDIHIYTRCQALNGGCIHSPSAEAWMAVRQTAAGSGALQLRVRASTDAGGGFGESAPITISFTRDPIRGVVYYWNTTAEAIVRWAFEDATPRAETFIDSSNVGGRCVGCHALSRDGRHMAASLDGQEGGDPVIFDVTMNPSQLGTFTDKSQFESWAPDNVRFVGVGKANAYTGSNELKLFDGTNGTSLGTIPIGDLRADHPDWSLDGSKIVFTTVDTTVNVTDQRPYNTGLAFIEQQGTGWSAPKQLIAITERNNNYYPSFAPDSQIISFNKSSCTADEFASNKKYCDCDTDPTAAVWATTVGGDQVELRNANTPGITDTEPRLTNTFPKWNPYAYDESEHNRTYWLTFSSTRNYGLRTPPAGTADESLLKRGTLLWMVAVSTSKMAAGLDPSTAAFCLPFQDITTSNHIAQWAEYVQIIP